MKLQQRISKLTTFLFLFILFAFFLLHLTLPQTTFSELENRYLSTAPPIELHQLWDKTYLNSLEESFNDQFPFRDVLISGKAFLDYTYGFGKTNDVYFGRDHYLINHTPSYNKDTFENNLQTLASFSKQQQLPMYMLVIPSKFTILSNKLPRWHYDIDEQPLWSSMKDRLSNMQFVDTFQALQQHHTESIFYQSDHHLTALGSYYVYQEYMEMSERKHSIDLQPEKIRSDFKGSLYAKSKAFWYPGEDMYIYTNPQHIQVEYEQSGDWSSSLYAWDNREKRDAYTFFLDGNHAIVKTHNPEALQRHVLILRDSFGQSFAPYIASEVSDVTFLDLRYYKASVSDYIQQHQVDEIIFLYSMDTLYSQSDIGFLK